MIEVTFMGALIAGVLSFLSPCVLPLVPAYLSYISGVSVDELRGSDAGEATVKRRHALIQALWFVAGFTLVFIALGASASMIGQWLQAHMASLGKLAGIIIMVFGLHYLGLLRIPLLMVDARPDASRMDASRGMGALVLGAAFAFGWTPCVGPILGAILALAGMQAEWERGMLLLSVYSLGLALPFMLSALATQSFMRWARGFRRHMLLVEKTAGILLVLMGALIFAGSFSLLSGWLSQAFPSLGAVESIISQSIHQ